MSLEQQIANARKELADLRAQPYFYGKPTFINLLEARIAYWSLKLANLKDRPSGGRISWN